MEKKLLYNDKQVTYEVRGSGKPVMLVHGFTEDRKIWDPLLQAICYNDHTSDRKDHSASDQNKHQTTHRNEHQASDQNKRKTSHLNDQKTNDDNNQADLHAYQWILPDLPGTGDSEYNDKLQSTTDFAQVLNAILVEENHAQATVIGHSMGGYISLAFAGLYPEKIRALGLFHSSAYPDSEEKKEVREKNKRFISKNGAALFVEQAIPGLFSEKSKKEHPAEIEKLIHQYANFSPASLVQYLEAMKNRPRTTDVLNSISKPVLFIMGEEDKAVPLKDALEQCHLPSISYIHILSDTAHMGMMEQTALAASYVDRFLKETTV